MREIELTQGKVALVDDCDYELLNEHKWSAAKSGKTFYAVRVDGKKTTIHMHRLIIGLVKGDGIKVDHKNHNGLDNQRENIRVCTNTENNRNQQTQGRVKSSQYKGVYKSANKWCAKIVVTRKNIHLGRFSCELEAAEAYDLNALKLFGEFAKLNFPKPS
jgi:hypothetical protein